MHRTVLATLLLCLGLPLYADELTIDLGASRDATELIRVGTYDTIVLSNTLLPGGGRYSVRVKKESQRIAPLDFRKAVDEMRKTLDLSALGKVMGGTPVPSTCTDNAAIESLQNAESEADVPRLVAELRRAMKDGTLASGCRALAQETIDLTTRTASTYLPLQAGDTVTVVVTRVGAKATEEWTKTFDTGERGRFMAHLGMGFLPDRDERYFTKQTSDSEFTITRKRDSRSAAFAPGAFFTWAPASAPSDWTHGPTVGLGFDLAAPTVMLGWSVVNNRTWGVAVGVAGHQQQRLAGEYREGDKLKENLAEDRLSEKTYDANIFISVLWRRGD